MASDSAQFVYMTCRPGAEQALKREVARGEPKWRLAFSRPGFLTFKVDADQPLDISKLAERRWTFAHTHGVSLGRVSGTQLGELARELWRLESVAALEAGETPPADLHVWQHSAINDPANSPSHDITDLAVSPLAVEIERALRATAPASFAKLHKGAAKKFSQEHRRPTPRGALVLDVFVLEPGQWWIGAHRAVTTFARWPGGAIPVRMPDHAVSRAYAKIEEAIEWSQLPLAPGDECVEIGCAPGGASQALLDRGMFVTGIDPADVDPAVLAHPRFRHLKKRGQDVRRREFVGVRWLAADMNIAPDATLDEVEPIVMHEGVTIRGLVLTLKMSDWATADRLNEFAQRVRAWGYRDVRLRQLVSGGQEVCLVALRRKALRRLGHKQSHRRKRTRDVHHPTGRTTQSASDEAASATGPLAQARTDAAHSRVSGPHF